MAKCDNCNGTGLIVTKAIAIIESDIDFTCEVCEGTGSVADETESEDSEKLDNNQTNNSFKNV